MFGYPSAFMKKKRPPLAMEQTRSHNLIRDVVDLPPEAMLDAYNEAEWAQRTRGSQTPMMPKLSPSSSVVGSVASSYCSTCGSGSSHVSNAISCSTCAEAERQRKEARARRRARQAECGSQVSGLSVTSSAYDHLTSVSQQRSTVTSQRSGGASVSSSVLAKLQEQLDQEKKQREATDLKLLELQRKQEELVAQLTGVIRKP